MSYWPIEIEALRALSELGLRNYTHDCILDYVREGGHPGDFLKALISNDLRGTVAHADDENILLIPKIVKWFYRHAPSRCWGSPEKFDAWMAESAVVA